MERPTYIDLSATSSRAPSSAGTARTGRPSPRIEHYDGDVPPVLSPLDAIAAESRRLAKELEATRLAGERRMSRLPPAIVTKSLSKHQANRPACFRTLSSNSQDALPTLFAPEDSSPGNVLEVTEPSKRPISSYPRISAVSKDDDMDDELFVTPRESASTRTPMDYFDVERAASPASIQDQPLSANHCEQQKTPHAPEATLFAGLLPPRAAFARNKSFTESSDEGYTSSNGGSTFSRPRKLSNSSGMSFPISPAGHAHERTPSDQSMYSNSSQKKHAPHFNFSRPLSAAGMNPRVDSPTKPPSRFLERKPSHLSETSRGMTSFEDDRSIASEGRPSESHSRSYTHKTFILPRGRGTDQAPERMSTLFAGLSTPDFRWQEPMFHGTPPLSATTLPEPVFSEQLNDPLSERLSEEASRAEKSGFSFDFGDRRRRTSDAMRPSSSHTLPKSSQAETVERSDYFTRPPTGHANNGPSYGRQKMPVLPPIPGSTADYESTRGSIRSSSRSQSKSGQSASTVRPSTSRTNTDYQALSADEHVEKAIELHQNGSLKESTYHLRIATKSHHPTAMLLYALACRHGWGMRQNEEEAIKWLRLAVDAAMSEVAEDEAAEERRDDRPKPKFLEKESHKAHFALGIYELGNSHLNGWGVKQDKALALRCFEIAGSWGDADALTEAGFCYAQGIGCKKNLKKAAKFYRMAADKGVSMVGNSWIYKDKYNDDKDDDAGRKARARKSSMVDEKEKKPRNKSKTRSIFGRKRANTTTQQAEL